MVKTEQIKNNIRQFITHKFPLASKNATVGDDSSLLESGIIDSLGVLDLVTFLEEAFNITISDLSQWLVRTSDGFDYVLHWNDNHSWNPSIILVMCYINGDHRYIHTIMRASKICPIIWNHILVIVFKIWNCMIGQIFIKLISGPIYGNRRIIGSIYWNQILERANDGFSYVLHWNDNHAGIHLLFWLYVTLMVIIDASI